MRISLFTLGLLAASLGNAQATTTLTFQDGINGYAGTKDTMIRSNETAAGAGQTAAGDSRGLNFGGLAFISVDGDDGSPGSKPNQGLIRFDNIFGAAMDQIKAGDAIVSAKLTVTVFDVGSGMTLHDMLVDWNENAATWNSMVGGVQVGTEAGATVIGSVGANNSSGNVSTGALSFDVTSSLQAWQLGAANYGWLMNPFVSGTNGIDFYSSEFTGGVSVRPMLTVEVMAIPEPESFALMLAGLACLGAVRRRSN